ncbi:MAG: hypothetical protein Q9192_000054 [Flavoplaca navasiana]
MLSPDHLTPQTRLFLAMLSHLQQHPPSPSPPPPYTTPPTSPIEFDPNDDPNPVKAPATAPTTFAFDPEDHTPPPASLQIHISAPTTIHGSHNRIVLPSPTHLSSLVSVAVKVALQQGEEEGEVKEDEHRVSVTVNAGTKIEGNGNVAVLDGRKGAIGGGGNEVGKGNVKECSSGEKKVGEGEAGRKRRACSEPVDTKRVLKRIKA